MRMIGSWLERGRGELGSLEWEGKEGTRVTVRVLCLLLFFFTTFAVSVYDQLFHDPTIASHLLAFLFFFVFLGSLSSPLTL